MIYSNRMANLMKTTGNLMTFFETSEWSKRVGTPGISDFMVGNPHEHTHPAFIEALKRHSTPQSTDWYAYKENELDSREHIASTLRNWRGLPFERDDIFLTNGAFSAITVALSTILDPGDEVIFISPPWFFYESLIQSVGGVPVRVRCDSMSYDIDPEEVAAAITDRTRAVIINTPNNPTGRIYPEETLSALAGVLETASQKQGRPVYLLSDEAYSRIIFDGKQMIGPSAFYANTFLIYTYSKTLLIPGQRLGYIALTPGMENALALRGALLMAQYVNGYAFPSALMQYSLPDIEAFSVDVDHYQRKRDRMVDAFISMGYEVTRPEGTFYLLVRAPQWDEARFIDTLAANDVFCLPGSLAEMPGYVRISITASDAMIERALPIFAEVIGEPVMG